MIDDAGNRMDSAKRAVRAFFMGLGMFTSIPCPWRPWDEDARGMMLVMLPVVGAAIGLLWAGLSLLARAWLPLALGAAVIAALPFVLTGFIHLDGFMDTCDAMLSWRPLEKRLEILKDSHTGSYAVVSVALLMMFSFAAAQGPINVKALALVPIISRCGSAFAVLSLKPIGHSEYAQMESRTAQQLAVVAIWLITMIAGVHWLGASAAALMVETLAYFAAMAWVVRTLKGVSGDLAGFALTMSEGCALVALAVIG